MSGPSHPVEKPRVAVLGVWNWLATMVTLLRRGGIDAEPVDRRTSRALLLWLLSGKALRYRVIHRVGGTSWWLGLALHLLGRKVIWHWIGSDIAVCKNLQGRGLRSYLLRRAMFQWAWAHLADSPELAEELALFGIQTRVVRLLPEAVQAPVEPLPDRFTVLSYWWDDRRDFYGGDIVLALAREMPDVEFLVVGATGRGETPPPNLQFLGHLKDLQDIYRRCSVLIRLPRHDSISAMVLELLARGRYVIYNKDLEGCHRADDLPSARRQLEAIRQLRQPNQAGADMVRRDFSPPEQSEALREIYRPLS